MPEEEDQGPGPDATAAETARFDADNAWYAVNYANSQLAAPVVAPTSSGGYLLDPDRMRETIAEMTRIADTVWQWKGRASPLRFGAPAYDPVSVNFAEAGRQMASRAEVFVDTWVRQIEAARDGLQAQLDTYLAVEAGNARRLT